MYDEIILAIATFVVTAALGWLARAVFTLQKLMEHETRPNGGDSFKDYMRETSSSLNRQTETMEAMRREMQEHNHLTNELIGSIIRSKR